MAWAGKKGTGSKLFADFSPKSKDPVPFLALDPHLGMKISKKNQFVAVFCVNLWKVFYNIATQKNFLIKVLNWCSSPKLG